MDAKQRKALFENAAWAMRGVPEEIRRRHVERCGRADKAYGEGVARALGLMS